MDPVRYRHQNRDKDFEGTNEFVPPNVIGIYCKSLLGVIDSNESLCVNVESIAIDPSPCLATTTTTRAKAERNDRE